MEIRPPISKAFMEVLHSGLAGHITDTVTHPHPFHKATHYGPHPNYNLHQHWEGPELSAGFWFSEHALHCTCVSHIPCSAPTWSTWERGGLCSGWGIGPQKPILERPLEKEQLDMDCRSVPEVMQSPTQSAFPIISFLQVRNKAAECLKLNKHG